VQLTWRIIGPKFLHKTINSERYTRLILSPFFDQMTDDEKLYGRVMQDNAMPHTTKNSINAQMISSVNES
jgi:hypothetical protein